MARGVFGPIIIGVALMGAGTFSACRHGGHERWRNSSECNQAASAPKANAPVTSPAPTAVAPETAPTVPDGAAPDGTESAPE